MNLDKLVKPISIAESPRDYTKHQKETDFLTEELLTDGENINWSFLDKISKIEKEELDEFKKTFKKDIDSIFDFDQIKEELGDKKDLTKEEKKRIYNKVYNKTFIHFWMKPENMIRLNIALNYRDVRITDFLRVMIIGFLSEDKRIISFFEEKFVNNARRKRLLELNKKKEKQIKDSFGLSSEETNIMYDILAEDVGF